MTALAYNAQGKWIVTSGEDGTVKVWDTRYVSVLSIILRNAMSCHAISLAHIGYDLSAYGESSTRRDG